jgi:hypothetical protein
MVNQNPYWCEICELDCHDGRLYKNHLSTAKHYLKTLEKPIQKVMTPAGTWTVNADGQPEINGRRVAEKGKHFGLIEISCPYCGAVHYHGIDSDKPLPAIRTSHCGLPYLCQTGSYYIKSIYDGPPQPKHQGPDWLNFFGDTVKILK